MTVALGERRKVYFYAYLTNIGVLVYSDYFSTFEEAWKSREAERFPASPVMEGWLKEEQND